MDHFCGRTSLQSYLPRCDDHRSMGSPWDWGPGSAGVNVSSTGDTNLDGLSCKDCMSVFLQHVLVHPYYLLTLSSSAGRCYLWLSSGFT